MITPRDITNLAHELSGVLCDTREPGGGWDEVCRDTVTRVREKLFDLAEEVRMLQASEREGWRYSAELESERVRLSDLFAEDDNVKELK
jgi:hypothetical protein